MRLFASVWAISNYLCQMENVSAQNVFLYSAAMAGNKNLGGNMLKIPYSLTLNYFSTYILGIGGRM